MKFDILKDVKNPRYSNADNSMIDVELTVTLDNGKTEVWQFTAAPDDREKHCCAIFSAAGAGQYGPIKPYEKR